MNLTNVMVFDKSRCDMENNIVINKGKRKKILVTRHDTIKLGPSTASAFITIETPKGEKRILRVNKDFKPFTN